MKILRLSKLIIVMRMKLLMSLDCRSLHNLLLIESTPLLNSTCNCKW